MEMKPTVNRKGQVGEGLETTRQFIIGILIIAVLAVASFVTVISFSNSTPALQTTTYSNNAFVNQTINLTATGNAPAAVLGREGVILTNVVILNANETGNEVVSAGNYSVSGGVIRSISAQYNNTNVNVSAGYSYTTPAAAQAVSGNLTGGITAFFASVPTIFVVLGGVAVILVVTLIVVAVMRFSGRSEEMAESI